MYDLKENNKYIEMARPLMETLEKAGYQGWLVGGCIREMMLQKDAGGKMDLAVESDVATDLDVATEARPEQVAEVFSDWPVIETGIKHGTITVLMPGEGSESIPVEVTTFRTEGEYSDGRRPDRVEFIGSIEADLARRDFSINAMAMDLRGKLADPYGGREDISEEIIRAVGDPEARFREDGLRIIRALRFAAVLGFEIEEKTEKALFDCRDLLDNIAKERIFAEFKKLICGCHADDVIRKYVDILSVVMPPLETMKGFDQNNPYHRFDVLEHCIRTMETVRSGEDNREYMRIAALFHDCGKPATCSFDEEGIGHFYGHPGEGQKIVAKLLRDLKADRATADKVEKLVSLHDLHFEEDERILKRWMARYGTVDLLEVLELKRADNIATGNADGELIARFDRVGEMIRRINAEGECIHPTDLAIGGRDLLESGLEEGPQIGRILDRLLDMVIDGDIKNERQALLEEARRLKDI